MLWHCGRTCSVVDASMVASKFLHIKKPYSSKGGALPAQMQPTSRSSSAAASASAAAAGSTAGRNEGCSTESAREGK